MNLVNSNKLKEEYHNYEVATLAFYVWDKEGGKHGELDRIYKEVKIQYEYLYRMDLISIREKTKRFFEEKKGFPQYIGCDSSGDTQVNKHNNKIRNNMSDTTLIPHEEIAGRAAQIWEQEGRPSGKDVEIWLRAEAELKQERSSEKDCDQSSTSNTCASSGCEKQSQNDTTGFSNKKGNNTKAGSKKKKN